MQRQLGEVTLEAIVGDIVQQDDMDAVVNAANARLAPGGGVAGAIHRAAGPGLYQECQPLAPIRPGEAVITGAHHLPNRHVIHVLGPVYGQDRPEDQLLAEAYRQALARAEEQGLESVAFPAISTGAFGYPLREATRIAVRTMAEEAPKLQTVKHIRFVCFSSEARQVYLEIMDEVPG